MRTYIKTAIVVAVTLAIIWRVDALHDAITGETTV